MGTLKTLLDIAIKEVGTYESPPNSNKVKYNTWYYKREVSGPDYPWCMVFCQWVFNQAGVAVPQRTASCSELLYAAKRHNVYVNKYHLQPGDLILYSFGRTLNPADHCGILKSIDGIKIEVIEGNTAPANDTNGGEVMIRHRITDKVVGAFRPIFDREEDLDMTKAEFLKSLSDKEAYELLQKAMKHANTLGETIKDGAMDKAKAKKIINDGMPQGLVTREQMATILDRSGIL